MLKLIPEKAFRICWKFCFSSGQPIDINYLKLEKQDKN